MGAIAVPSSGVVYLDSNCVIYSVEKIPPYWPLLQPLWSAAKTKSITLMTSELAVLEVLSAPIKRNNAALRDSYERLLLRSDFRLEPISLDILRKAAELRAVHNFKSPDAIHAATALSAAAVLFLTNDTAFRKLASPPVGILSDILAAPGA